MKKSVLIIGGGGREHALAWKLKQSPNVERIFVAPGNGGTAQIATNVDIAATDILKLADFVQTNKIDFTVVGQDDPLALGIVDEFQKRGLKIWGPSKSAAQIEASKAFAKQLMKDNRIPTADYQTFSDYNQALEYIEEKGAPIVIKASGLALGKGVTVCKTLDEAKAALKGAMVDKIFGDAGGEVVIEEFLQGPEFSIHAFCDGKNFKLLPAAQDHKPIYDNDLGPNTGGMGTVSPLPWVNAELMDEVATKIVQPALAGLSKLGSPFVGLLYPGLMLTKDGPKVIEFNARFGDPETQSLMRLLKTDLLDVLEACVDGKIDKINIEWSKQSACCVVLASGGYPGKYEKSFPIKGIEEASKLDGVLVFHAGTKVEADRGRTNSTIDAGGQAYDVHQTQAISRQLVTNGGRVLGV